MNYILVDFENVQPKSLEQLADKHFKVILFVGASQTRLPKGLGSRVQQVKISGHGPNALDFHIPYYIGRLAVIEPSAYFHIISKDRGYDPLIRHLRSQKLRAYRFATIAAIPIVKASLQERIDIIVKRLHKLKAKPGTIKKLRNMIVSWFHLSEQDVALLIQSLAHQGYLKFTGSKVTYRLPIT